MKILIKSLAILFIIYGLVSILLTFNEGWVTHEFEWGKRLGSIILVLVGCIIFYFASRKVRKS